MLRSPASFQPVGQILADAHRQDDRPGEDHATRRRRAITSMPGIQQVQRLCLALIQDLRLAGQRAATSARSFSRFSTRSRVDFPPPAGPEQHGDRVGRDLQADAFQRFGAVRVAQGQVFDHEFIHGFTRCFYHWRRARARERMMVASMFRPSTRISSTSAVPYWIRDGMPGTWVEMTYR